MAQAHAAGMLAEHAFLDLAKAHKWEAALRQLREAPGLVNAQPLGRWSALHQAALAGDAAAARELLRFGANVRALTNDRKTPREVANGADVRRLLEVAEAGGDWSQDVAPRTHDTNFARQVALSPLIGDRHLAVPVDARTGEAVAEGLRAERAALVTLGSDRSSRIWRERERSLTWTRGGFAKNVGNLKGVREKCDGN